MLGRRLQIQERLTVEIADILAQVLRPRVAWRWSRRPATNACPAWGALQGVSMQTRRLLGEFAQEPRRREILATLAG